MFIIKKVSRCRGRLCELCKYYRFWKEDYKVIFAYLSLSSTTSRHLQDLTTQASYIKKLICSLFLHATLFQKTKSHILNTKWPRTLPAPMPPDQWNPPVHCLFFTFTIVKHSVKRKWSGVRPNLGILKHHLPSVLCISNLKMLWLVMRSFVIYVWYVCLLFYLQNWGTIHKYIILCINYNYWGYGVNQYTETSITLYKKNKSYSMGMKYATLLFRKYDVYYLKYIMGVTTI